QTPDEVCPARRSRDLFAVCIIHRIINEVSAAPSHQYRSAKSIDRHVAVRELEISKLQRAAQARADHYIRRRRQQPLDLVDLHRETVRRVERVGVHATDRTVLDRPGGRQRNWSTECGHDLRLLWLVGLGPAARRYRTNCCTA